MMRVDVTKRDLEDSAYLKRIPSRHEVGRLIDREAVVYLDGRPVIAYVKIPDEVTRPVRDIVKAGRGLAKSTRVNGLPTQSIVHGAMPRVTMRNDYCRYTSASRQFPDDLVAMMRVCTAVAGVYRDVFPEGYETAMGEISSKVHRDWRMTDTPFTTANVNINHAIRYHRDSGNFRSQHSNVLILKDGIVGGELVCPEYGITFHQGDGFCIIFDGQSVLHGVLPIQANPLAAHPYRASVVFYSMQAMCKCLARPAELRRMAEERTRKESVTTAEQRARVREINKRYFE